MPAATWRTPAQPEAGGASVHPQRPRPSPNHHSAAGENLRRMSRARHGLYMVIVGVLVERGVRYTLPPYQGMPAWQGGAGQGAPAPWASATPGGMPGFQDGAAGPGVRGDPLRPPGEGQSFMPPFARKAALKL